MDSYGHSNPQIRQLSGDALRKMEPYKGDEGYSEETRSSDGSESSTRMDQPSGGEEMMQDMMQLPLTAAVEYLMRARGASEHERAGQSDPHILITL